MTNSKCNFQRNETENIEIRNSSFDSSSCLPKSVANVGVHDNGMETERYVWAVDKLNSDCFVYEVTFGV